MPEALNPEGIVNTLQTSKVESLKQFRLWFGKSQIVNEDGFPKRVYHGTNMAFAIFQSKKRNPELGFHFGSISQAEFFAGYGSENVGGSLGCVMPVYLRIENPLRLFDIFERGRRSAENVARWLRRDGVIDQRTCARIFAARSARAACLRMAMAIEALGYDGIVYGNEWEGGSETINEDAYVAFRSEQIKSVFNRGTFNPVSANILE
jgi:hypothetical protein